MALGKKARGVAHPQGTPLRAEHGPRVVGRSADSFVAVAWMPPCLAGGQMRVWVPAALRIQSALRLALTRRLIKRHHYAVVVQSQWRRTMACRRVARLRSAIRTQVIALYAACPSLCAFHTPVRGWAVRGGSLALDHGQGQAWCCACLAASRLPRCHQHQYPSARPPCAAPVQTVRCFAARHLPVWLLLTVSGGVLQHVCGA